MNDNLKHVRTSARKQVRDLSGDFAKFAKEVQEAFATQTEETSKVIGQLNEIINSMLAVLGISDKVAEHVNTTRKAKATKEMEEAKASLESLKSKGFIVADTTVKENSIVVGHEVGDNGEVIFPGWQHFSVNQFKPEFKKAIVGGAVGVSLVPQEGRKFIVDEIYTIDHVAVAKSRAAESAAATEVVKTETAVGTEAPALNPTAAV